VPAGIKDPELRGFIEDARQRVQAEPRSAIAWADLGLTLLAHHFDAEAAPCFAEAARLGPDNPLWPYARAVIARKGDAKEALAFLREAAELASSGPEGPAYRLALAEALLERRDTAAAETIFREELGANPRDARAALGLGRLLLERGDDEAAALLEAAAREPFARKQATGHLAALARARGETARADKLEKKAAEMPDDPPWPDPLDEETARREVGVVKRVHDMAGLESEARRDPRRYRQIAEVYLREIKERPTARDCALAGFSLARAGDFDAALPLLRQAEALDPDNSQTCDIVAQVLFDRAEKEAARAPGSEQARAWFREAAEQARRATELKVGHSRGYLVWGRALRGLGEPAAAVGPLRLGVQCEPGCLDLQLSLGEALLEAGRHGEARAALENARRLAPADRRVAEALERLRHKGGGGPTP
jgi:tetratricopeptide (TPR) repeat protein